MHPANIAAARLKVATDGSIDLKLRFDVLAYVLEELPDEATAAEMAALADAPGPKLSDRLADAQVRLRSDLKLTSGASSVVVDSVMFPTADEVRRAADQNGPTRFPVMITVPIRAHLAAGEDRLSVSFPEILGTVVLTTELPYQEPISEPVEAGSTSTEIRVPSQKEIAGAKLSMRAETPALALAPASALPSPRASASALASPSAPASSPTLAPTLVRSPTSARAPAPASSSVPAPALTLASRAAYAPAPAPAPASSSAPAPAPAFALASPSDAAPINSGPPWWVLLGRYVKMGFHHILPLGPDHVLFVLGLFLLSSKTKDLMKQVSAFTVAHSLTLALSLYGLVQLPSRIVEPLIAISIAFVAIENLYTSKTHAWRPAVVFGFGLVHGLGFASALRETGLVRGDFLTGLVGFNLGVELGQLAVVACAFAAVGWLRKSPRYRLAVVMPASVAIAAVALFWTVQRVF